MRGMLDGVRVIDFTANISGPATTQFLTDMGAEVIKVEKPGGEDARFFPPYKNGFSGSFLVMNRGKKAITIDIKKPEGVMLFKELVGTADVLVENFRPGVMNKLGLGYDVLKEVNPKLIMLSLSGYGQYGPLSHLPAYDSIMQAMSGFMSSTGYEGGEPLKTGSIVLDLATAMNSAFSICAALFARERTGEGEYLDISMYDTAVNLLEVKWVDYTINGNLPRRTGNRYPHVTPFDSYKTMDGHVMICCAGDKTFQTLCNGMGMPELIKDERFCNFFKRNENESELKKIVEDWAADKTSEQVFKVLSESGAPVAPINDIKAVFEHPHTEARGLKVDVDQPGAGIISIYGPSQKARNSEIKNRGYSPRVGEHNLWLLQTVLGKDMGEMKSIFASGAMGPVPEDVKAKIQ